VSHRDECPADFEAQRSRLLRPDFDTARMPECLVADRYGRTQKAPVTVTLGQVEEWEGAMEWPPLIVGSGGRRATRPDGAGNSRRGRAASRSGTGMPNDDAAS